MAGIGAFSAVSAAIATASTWLLHPALALGHLIVGGWLGRLIGLAAVALTALPWLIRLARWGAAGAAQATWEPVDIDSILRAIARGDR